MFNECKVVAEERTVHKDKRVLVTIGELVLEKEANDIYLGCIKINGSDYKHIFESVKTNEEIDAFSNFYYKFCPYYFETHNVVGTLWGLLVVVTDEADEGRIRLCGVGLKKEDKDKEYVVILKTAKEGNKNAQGYKERV